jgi:hypothetical protein
MLIANGTVLRLEGGRGVTGGGLESDGRSDDEWWLCGVHEEMCVSRVDGRDGLMSDSRLEGRYVWVK